MLSLDGGFHKALLPSVCFILNVILANSLALEVHYRSHLRHYSLPILNDLAGALEELINDAFIVAWMLGLAGLLVACGRVAQGTSLSKVQFGALTHASKSVSGRLIDELPPDPVSMLLHLPVLEPAEKLAPPLAHAPELLLQVTTLVPYPLPHLSIRYTCVTRLLKDVLTFTGGVVFSFRGGSKMLVNFSPFETLAIL